MSERHPGTAQYGARSFTMAPEGGEPASTARRSGAAAASAAAPSPLVPRPPAAPPPRQPRPARSGPARSSSLPHRFAHRYCCPHSRPSPPSPPQPLQLAGWSPLPRPGSWGLSVGRALVVSGAPMPLCLAGNEPRSVILHSFTSRLEWGLAHNRRPGSVY